MQSKPISELRAAVVAARRDGRADQEAVLTGLWQGRLQQLVLDEPAAAQLLREVVDRVLLPLLDRARSRDASVVLMTGESHDDSTFIQAGRDQYIQRG